MTDNNFHKLALSESFERVAKVAKERDAFNEQMAAKTLNAGADNFRGNNDSLRSSIAALLDLDAANAIAPHGIGSHARRLLSASYHRLPQ